MITENTEKDKWLYEITPKAKLLSFDFTGIWQYRDLLMMFVKRDVVTYYKQTILGPLWFLIQPLVTSIIQFIVFFKIAKLESDGIPYFLFALAGNTLWFYFSECFKTTSDTFKTNQNIFGKVYFPRIIMPLSTTISNLLKFGIQFLLFIAVLGYYIFKGFAIAPQWTILFTPLLLIVMALMSLGLGMIISSLTTKYRDLTFVVSFGVSLYMYITPVIYPTSQVIKELPAGYDWLVYVNPLTSIFEFFKYSFLGKGTFTILGLAYSAGSTLLLFLIGLTIFNRTEKSFIDTI
ncbi:MULTISPECIES: ABC transporter permease [Flavobacterium]|uniref:ABC transporter permease n=1 Tax=Flavobacterium TaxID=237 RepID=UPI00086F6018|nr:MULTISPECIES: ABC transporter permease [Flavobacterium]MBN9285036.1 ABC transporter permease [Flavobacterium sp.]ODS81727.1 MAG: ABC transporter permease [Chryseobacterium sp. SCN 40-13]OJV69856.1 MAG: ABC transporter permease [Flavobacterium sp. 40-81]